jgi:hypothetical protein
MPPEVSPLRCLNVQAWRLATPQEISDFLDSRDPRQKRRRGGRSSTLAVREHLSPADIYCYLKARFGEPNGFQTFLRNKDTSENWIHWDFFLKDVAQKDVYLCGMSRETHIMVPGPMTAENWRDLIRAIKADYARVGKEKSAVFKTLEKWAIFPNRFIEVANICADLHAEIGENIEGLTTYKTVGFKTKRQARESEKQLNQFGHRLSKVYRPCLELSLLTPVLAETFINMLILILCKQEVRRNKRQFDAFIRSHIDVKLFDLHLKCEGFARGIDADSLAYKKFKQVMDKRNDIIHGNTNPEAEQLETVYFDGKRPLFKEPGDHIGRFWEAMERHYQPALVVQQYVDTYSFLLDIVAHLKCSYTTAFWQIMEDNHPGYDVDRRITGRLLPDHVTVCTVSGLVYDDQLSVDWG